MSTDAASHEQLLAMRERMRHRVASGTDDAVPAARAAPAASVVVEPAAAASSPLDTSEPSSSVLADLKRSQALRDRIHNRNAAGPRVSAVEQTRDTYAHQRDFPVSTVFEMERVTTSNHHGENHAGDRRPETLLMAAESASVLRAVESRLGQESERAVTAERRLEVNAKALEKTTQERDEFKKNHDVAEAKIKELKEEMEKMKKAHTDAVEALKKEHTAELTAQKAGIELKAKADVTSASEAAKKDADAREATETEKKLYEALVAEMRAQLASNGIALQNQTMTIRQLTEELLAARAQVTNLSVALQDKEREVKNAKADIHRLGSDASKTSDLQTELAGTKDALERAQLDLKKAKADADALPAITEERNTLQSKTSKLEVELRDKTSEMARLRSQVESVRSQADAAYLHSSQFHGQAGPPPGGPSGGLNMSHTSAPGGGGYGGGGYGGAGYGGAGYGGAGYGGGAGGSHGQGNPEWQALQREIEEEGRRADEQQRRWKQRLAKA